MISAPLSHRSVRGLIEDSDTDCCSCIIDCVSFDHGSLKMLLRMHIPLLYSYYYSSSSSSSSSSSLVVALSCRYVPAGNTSNIAATGTTPHTATLLLVSIRDKPFHRHYIGQPALLNRHYRGTSTVLTSSPSSSSLRCLGLLRRFERAHLAPVSWETCGENNMIGQVLLGFVGQGQLMSNNIASSHEPQHAVITLEKQWVSLRPTRYRTFCCFRRGEGCHYVCDIS